MPSHELNLLVVPVALLIQLLFIAVRILDAA